MNAGYGARVHIVLVLVAVLLIPGFPAVTLAQDTQRQPTEETVAPAPGGFRDWIAKTIEAAGDRKDGIAASAGIIIAGSGLSGGVNYRRLDALRGLDVQAGASVSVRRYQEHYFSIGNLEARATSVELDTAGTRVSSLFNDSALKEPGSALYAEARFRAFPRHTYYGTGFNSLESDRADYALSGTSIEGVWQWQLNPRFGLSVRGGVLDLDVGPGANESIVNIEERFAPAALPGMAAHPRFLTIGIGLVHDTRERPGAPYDGTFAGFSARRFATGADEYDFTRLTADLRAYKTPFTSRGVVALRAFLSTDVIGDNGGAPFYLLQSLGGGEMLRGFHSYRFHDHALLHFTAEYRWRAHRFVEIAPFIDTGTAARAFSRLSLDTFKATPGVALRARSDRRILARLEWARSEDGHRIVIGTGPLF